MESKMRLWVDDERPMPVDYDIHVRSSYAAVEILRIGFITHVSLDHDLGPGENGYVVAQYIETAAYYGDMQRLTWNVHSANPPGGLRMEAALKSADRFWSVRDGHGQDVAIQEEKLPEKATPLNDDQGGMGYREDGRAGF